MSSTFSCHRTKDQKDSKRRRVNWKPFGLKPRQDPKNTLKRKNDWVQGIKFKLHREFKFPQVNSESRNEEFPASKSNTFILVEPIV